MAPREYIIIGVLALIAASKKSVFEDIYMTSDTIMMSFCVTALVLLLVAADGPGP